MSEESTVEQPTPHGKGPDIAPLVCADIMARSAVGEKKYGEPLKAFNGRDPLVDLYQELLDGAQYIRQAIEERKKAPALPREALRYLEAATEPLTLEPGTVYHEFYHDPEGSIPGAYNANFYLWCIVKARATLKGENHG